MSVVKHNTYFKENDGKVYYYDAEGIKKEIPSTAFSNLQEQIDNLGSPLTYSGAQSVDELNEMVDIKTGTVYTVTGNSGTLTAGGIDVQPSTEVAWAGEWFNIGKDLDNSWKQWSEDNNTTSNGFDNVYIGDYNNISGNVNYVIGRSNNANENSTDNTIIGKENTIKNENSNTILGRNNTISGNYTNTNTVIGNSNTASGTHNSFIIGEQNATIDQDGAGNSYVLGQNNAAGDCSLTLGTANSSQPGSFYKATLGWGNKVGNSNNVVIGGNNSATEKAGKNTIIAGYVNETSGGFAFGDNNKVNADSYAYGYNNSAIESGFAVGKNLYVSDGGVALGNAQSSTNGAVTIGESNSASNGGGVIGNNNIGGKGGYVIGYGNISRKYEIINPDNPSTSSIEYEVAPLGSLWSQNTFGFNNYTQFKKENGSYSHGMPFQIGSYNIVQDEITWNRDYDTEAARTYQNGGSYIGTFNIGTNNSAFDEGINIGYQNTILIGDSTVASINIGKDNVNRMGIIIGQRNVTYTTYASSTDTKSNAFSWIFGQFNSANGASVAIGNGTKAEQGSYAFGGWGTQSYSGAMSIGLGSLYSDSGAIAIGSSATAYNGSLSIGCGGLYTTSASFGFGNNVTAQKGSIGIGRNSVYATDDGYAFGEYVTAGADAVGIGRYVCTSGHGYAFGYQVTGASEGIAVGVNGITAAGQGAAFGFESVYSNGGSIALGHNGINANASAVALGSDSLYSDYRSIAIGQFGVTATSAGLTIGNENVYSTDRAIAIGKYGVGARGWGSFAIGIKGISADNTSWAIGYGGRSIPGITSYIQPGISATNESFAIGQSGISSINNSYTLGRRNLLASEESFVMGQKNVFAHDRSFNIGLSGADESESTSNIIYNLDYGVWYNSFAIGLGRNVAHNGSFILGIHNNYGIENINLPYSADNNSIMMAVGDGLSSRTIQDSVSIASYGSYDGLSGKSTVEYQSLLLDHQVLGDVEVKNKSIMIGGPSFCQFHFNDDYSALSANVKEGSAKADHASIVLGYNNIADGGVFAIGSNNTACDLYSESSGDTQYTQATIFGDYNRAINYRGTIYFDDVDSDLYNNGYDKNTQYTQKSGFTRSLIVGTNNSLSGWNSFIFGINNSAGSAEYALGTYDTSDDGFTLVFGHSNYAARNYDMAFGWKSFASGGENIAIGTPQQIDSYNVKCTSAIGYKNIAIRSNVEGTNNIAINSILYGAIPGFENNESKQNGNEYLNTILTFSNNVKAIDYFNNNKIDNSFITASNTPLFVYNNISDTSAVFSGAHTHNTFEHNTYLNLSTPYNSDGIEHNYIGHSNLTANVYETSNNILNNVNGIINSCQQMHRNLIYNTNITATFNEDDRGFSNNLIQNSNVNVNVAGFGESFIFDSSVTANSMSWWASTNKNFLVGSRLLINQETFNSSNYDNSIYDNISRGNAGNHVLFGSNVINSYNVFSFSDIYSNNISDEQNGFVQDSCKIFNVFDNITRGATNTVVLGESNRISGPKYTTIIGNNNGILNTNTKISVRNSLTINGDDNNYIDFTELNADRYGVSQYNRIYGDYNNFVTNWEGNSTDFITTHNTIIGDCNSYQYMDMNLLSGADTIYEASKKSSYFGKNAALPSFLNYGYNKQNITISQPTTASNRNTIIGSHNIISQFINDTILIGSYNVTINEDNRYVKEALKSNNYALGSYNLLRNGSNQIVLGTNNVSTGFNSTAIGEGLISKQSQFVVGRFNEELDGTNGLSAEGIDSTSGALFIVGNGKHINDDYDASAVVRSNAMIVSADGTVSARRFIESEPALTITGGDYVSVTEDTTNNKLVIDLESSLGQLLTELSGVLTAKPTTGRHILGVDDGTLTWLEINQ